MPTTPPGMPTRVPNLLSIAGLDPSAGAGIAADLATFAALGCYGTAAVTAVTVQNTRRVFDVHVLPPDLVAREIDAIFDDIDIAAVKIGMLATPAIAEAVASRLRHHRPRFVVLDPVLAATSGDPLAAAGVAEAIVRHLLPLATLVTPNLVEAATLAAAPVVREAAEMRALARSLEARGARAVLVKGGHLSGATSDDLLFDGVSYEVFSASRIATRNTHGTGCTLSSAIAARLAQGCSLVSAIRSAKAYVTGALAAADALEVGEGHGPLHHFYEFWRSDG